MPMALGSTWCGVVSMEACTLAATAGKDCDQHREGGAVMTALRFLGNEGVLRAGLAQRRRRPMRGVEVVGVRAEAKRWHRFDRLVK